MTLGRSDLLRLTALAGGSLLARAQSMLPGIPNIGVKADRGPVRSESGVGALLPWADVL